MTKNWKILAFILCLVGFFHNQSYAKFTYRPYYAQSSNLAYSQSLGYSSIILPYQSSSIMQAPSFLNNNTTSSLTGGYGFTQYSTNAFDIAYVSPNVLPGFVFGLEYMVNLISPDTFMNNTYFKGSTHNLGFEQVLAGATSYSLGESGTFGLNLKIPLNNYKPGVVDGGVLLGASYNINFFGFDFMVGLANIGAMYVNQTMNGVYPDIQAGIGYSYKDTINNESIFDLGFSIENNLGEFINNSFIFGMGGRIRVFSTGFVKDKPLIKDDILQNRDNRKKEKTLKDTLSTLQTLIYLNIGFQFANESHFSIGVTSVLNNYMIDLGFIFPSALTKRFGFYVSVGSSL